MNFHRFVTRPRRWKKTPPCKKVRLLAQRTTGLMRIVSKKANFECLDFTFWCYKLHIKLHLEPTWPVFLKANPPKQGLFQSKQGSFVFQAHHVTMFLHVSWLCAVFFGDCTDMGSDCHLICATYRSNPRIGCAGPNTWEVLGSTDIPIYRNSKFNKLSKSQTYLFSIA